MVNTLRNRSIFGGVEKTLLSTGQVLQELGITKQTLYKWIITGKIKTIKHEIGKRMFLEFDPKEIDRVKSLLKKNREKGKSLLKE